jgi:transposase-like protein
MSNGSWRVDETYIRVKGRWTYLYRAVDSRGQTVDFLRSAKRDADAAKRFFRKALGQPHTINPRTITVDKTPASPCAVSEMKEDGELWRFSRLRQAKVLNNIVEQDHRHVKRLVRPGLGFGSFWTARRTLAGYEAMAMVRKGQVQQVGGRDMRAQATFIAELFQVASRSRPDRPACTTRFAPSPDFATQPKEPLNAEGGGPCKPPPLDRERYARRREDQRVRQRTHIRTPRERTNSPGASPRLGVLPGCHAAASSRSASWRVPGWRLGRCGSAAAYALSDN